VCVGGGVVCVGERGRRGREERGGGMGEMGVQERGGKGRGKRGGGYRGDGCTGRGQGWRWGRRGEKGEGVQDRRGGGIEVDKIADPYHGC